MSAYLEIHKIIEQHRSELEVLRNMLEAYEHMLRETERLESADGSEPLCARFPLSSDNENFNTAANCQKSAA